MWNSCGRGTKALISAFGWGILPLTERAWDSRLNEHDNTFGVVGRVLFEAVRRDNEQPLFFCRLSHVVVRFVSESPKSRSKFLVSSVRFDYRVRRFCRRHVQFLPDRFKCGLHQVKARTMPHIEYPLGLLPVPSSPATEFWSSDSLVSHFLIEDDLD